MIIDAKVRGISQHDVNVVAPDEAANEFDHLYNSHHPFVCSIPEFPKEAAILRKPSGMKAR